MFRAILAAALLVSGAASAEVNLPRVAEAAASYRTSLDAHRTTADAPRLLREIRQAETAGRTVEVVRLYEDLVRLNPASVRAWLQLGTALRAVDRTADKALGAAFNAYRAAAGDAPNQVEALLLASSVMRARLEQSRKTYADAREQAERANKFLRYINDPKQEDIDRSIDPTDPTGTLRTLQTSAEAGERRADEAIRQVSDTAADLDEIYREIAAIVPGANAEGMQGQDARSALFSVATIAKSGKLRVSYRISGSDIAACLTFNQELLASGLAYRDFVKVTSGGEAPPVGLEVKGSVLCLTQLRAGESYELSLLESFPSKNGARLGAALTEEIKLPDLPSQISFSGRRFVLPAGGPGEIPLRVTNMAGFDLELFRISDRTLYRHIALGHVGGTMPYTEYADLKDRFAERLWAGSVQVVPGVAKPNEPTRIGLKARSVLEQRREWLAREIREGRAGNAANASPQMPMAGGADDKARVSGRFFAGSAPFEAAVLDRPATGVYALVTAESPRDSDAAEEEGGVRDCTRKRMPDGHDACDTFMVQWFLETDLGLAFYEGDTTFTVVARSFRGGDAKAGATIELISTGNRVLASATTDALGVASFPINLTRGSGSNALVAILAHQSEDFGFIPFGRERLDLSRLNVDGRQAAQGLNAFLTSERGLYQPGETVNLLTLLRDVNGRAPDAMPRTVVRVEARDRVLVQRRLEPGAWKLGGARIELPIPATARPGQARISLALGEAENATILGEMQIQLGPVRPDRARLDFLQPGAVWARKTSSGSLEITGSVAAQYLYGVAGTSQARLRDAKAEVVVKVGAAESPRPGCFQGFAFGRFDDRTAPLSSRQFVEFVDQDGTLNLAMAGIPMPGEDRPMAATVEVTLFDTAGPLASRSRSFPIADDAGWVGLSSVPRLRSGARPGTVDLGVDLAWSRDEARGGALTYRLERERELYIWQRQSSTWQYVRSLEREVVGSGGIEAASLVPIPSGAAGTDGRPCGDTFSAPGLARDLEVGRYVLTVTDPATQRMSAVRFNVGATSTDADQLEPNIFVLSSDKTTYRAGEPVVLTADAPFESGELLVAFADGDVRHWAQAHIQNRRATISLPARPEWVGRGLYALATAYRSGADGNAATGPARALGATHFEVKGADTGYGVRLQLVDGKGGRLPLERASMGSGEDLTFEVCVAAPSGCSTNPPEEAYAAVFVVDEGLLSLTGQGEAPPDPERHFYGRKRFGLQLMDNYDRLLLKEGGDRPTRLALSNYTSRHIVSETRGPLKLEGGRVVVTIPKLAIRNGSAAIYAVVWSRTYSAIRTATVAVRSPIVADLDPPSFLLAGDRAVLPLRLQNLDFAWDNDIVVKVAGAGTVAGVAISADPGRFGPLAPGAELRLPLRDGDPAQTFYVAVDASGRGKAEIEVSLEAPGSTLPLRGSRQNWTIEVRDADLSSVETLSFPLMRQPTNLARLAEGVVTDGFRPETVTVSAYFATDAVRLLAATSETGPAGGPLTLDHLVWRGMQLLHRQPGQPGARDPEVVSIIGNLQSLQQPNGSYVPFRAAGEFAPGEVSMAPNVREGEDEKPDGLIRTSSAFDFASLAKAAGYEVPERGLRAARIFIFARAKARLKTCSFEVAYAYLVLVSHSPTTMSRDQIDDLKDCGSGDLLTQSAAAAASARFGMPDQAKLILAGFEESKDPAALANLDDYRTAQVLTFLGEAGASPAASDTVADRLLQLDKRASLSRAATAWILRSASERPKAGRDPREARAEISVTGGSLHRRPDGVMETDAVPFSRLRAAQTTVSSGDARARGRLVVEGLASRPSEASRLPPGSLRRRYFDLESGQERNVARTPLRLGDRIVVVLEGRRDAVEKALANEGDAERPQDASVLVADLLPSSFQVMAGDVFRSTSFSLSGPLAKLKPLGDLRSVETRSDRWIGLIVPESGRAAAAPDDADGTPASPETPSGPAKASPDDRKASPDDRLEFRQAYMVRVGMAGRFTAPPLSIEASTPPVRTLRSGTASLEVGLPSLGDR